ncbi:hypothetical protein LCGC14_1448980 [marine sediment metagenome]|uniref:Uncharacterized protein n=1 Tax=marine sediment metagenome TaxID=412755 RepID=A0A0F9MKB6_9ZZZZ
MFKNIHNNSLLNKMKKIYNACVKPTNLNYDLKLFILIKKLLLSRVFNALFSVKNYSNLYYAIGHYLRDFVYPGQFSYEDVIL